jgi:hypothetical protein
LHLKRRLPAVVVVVFALALALAALPQLRARAATSPYLGLVSMGMPTAPQPWMPTDFAITKHLRNNAALQFDPSDGGSAMTADHGADCGPPPGTHPTSGAYASMTFVCHDHLMTALNADQNGYGELVVQPNQLVDFSGGATATVSISVSTFRTSDRDWISFHFTPFAEQQAYLETIADSQVMPPDDLQLALCSSNQFALCAQETVGGTTYAIPGDSATTVESLIPPSKAVRTPLSMALSQTHLRVTMAGHTFYDTPLPRPLAFSQSIFQFIHHSYTPSKDGCEFTPPAEQGALGRCNAPDTWHWSTLAIDRAVPYYLSMGMPEAVGDGQGNRVTFAPAPAGAHIRFQSFTNDYQPSTEASFDNGATWGRVNNQNGAFEGHASNAWLPVPPGATSMLLRGTSQWYARDFYVMSLATS